ncbi:FG-GAP repeat domain-containing protein [Amycolatopsis lurida]
MFTRKPRAAARRPVVVALVVALLLPLTAGPASAALPTPDFGPSIDGYAVSDPQSTCAGAQPGVMDFRDLLNQSVGTHAGGIVRGCDVGGPSEHKEGRALDYMLNVANPAERAVADSILNWLLSSDKYGNPHAYARRLGIMYIIWNHHIWEAYRPNAGWQPYSGPSPHTDHIHFSFSWAGAKKQTTWWTTNHKLRRIDRDFSGDGFGDMTVISADGYLDNYMNNMNVNTGGAPFTHAQYRSPAASWAGTQAISGGDWSGDGYADLAAVAQDGYLHLYPNNTNVNSDGRPFTYAQFTSDGPSWNGTKQVGLGDISGDGFADLLHVDADGWLYCYPNNATSNPGGRPFTSAQSNSPGTTWGNLTAFTVGHLDNDRYADLLVVDGDGYLYGYYNNGRAGLGELPFTNAAWRSEAPSWGGMQSISLTDVSGDTVADLMVVTEDGYLHYYPNNYLSNPGNRPFTGTTWTSPTATWNDHRIG